MRKCESCEAAAFLEFTCCRACLESYAAALHTEAQAAEAAAKVVVPDTQEPM